MTAQGVMTGASPSVSILTGGNVRNLFQKDTKEAGFEDYLKPSGHPGDSVKQNDEVKSKADLKNFKKAFRRTEKSFSGKETEATQKTENPESKEMVNEEELAEAVNGLLVQVKKLLCDQLEITEEELGNKMKELSLTDTALLSREGLQELFLNVKQGTDTDLLTNESLFDDFAELMQAVEQKVAKSGIGKEDLKAFEELSLGSEELSEYVPLKSKETQVTEHGEEKETKLSSEEKQKTVLVQHTENKSKESFSNEKDDSTNGHFVKARVQNREKEISVETDHSLKTAFLDTMTKATVEAGMEPEAAISFREIADQLMEQIKIQIRPEQTNLELQLNPEHLGRVHLSITEKEGMMTAQITTETQTAKEAIETQMTSLLDSLRDQGIKVEAMEVMLSDFSFEKDRDTRQKESGEEGKRKKQNSFEVEKGSDTERTDNAIFGLSDNSVDYSA